MGISHGLISHLTTTGPWDHGSVIESVILNNTFSDLVQHHRVDVEILNEITCNLSERKTTDMILLFLFTLSLFHSFSIFSSPFSLPAAVPPNRKTDLRRLRRPKADRCPPALQWPPRTPPQTRRPPRAPKPAPNEPRHLPGYSPSRSPLSSWKQTASLISPTLLRQRAPVTFLPLWCLRRR